MMNRPSPPSETYAAIVAVATICSIEDRMPEMIRGSALGTSTRQSTCMPLMPMPLAASRAAGSTFWIPAYVADRTAGTPRMTNTITAGSR